LSYVGDGLADRG